MIWVLSLTISRLFIFQQAYSSHVAKIQDEQWLLQQCEEPVFYSNIRQHTDLCEVRTLPIHIWGFYSIRFFYQ